MILEKDESSSQRKTLRNHRWIYSGLFWGLFMFVFMEIVFPYAKGELVLSFTVLFKGFLVWMLGGLIFGLIQKQIEQKWNVKT